ncbi:dihydrodipicolinate synthase family protein [Microbacterium sp. ET2]|uniref:dihydrodipicolinate synthase family protein n=1 Tax=Microbacterium albipurpureum TaxID=3050384 RepID=UPI00259CCE6D|nr:dihydrodipicolinate synthase family protein [Microbacterium sp. ET2 (Ac-2212)]WJL96984.1 dihydrodipicolinate synthase family protein [Microbacterium sp. ET2 (Ac-2212)]
MPLLQKQGVDVLAALPTLFTRALEVDEAAMRALVESVAPHVTGIFACGTNAEFPTLTFAERAALTRLIIGVVGPDRVIVHVGDVTTWGARQLAAAAVESGAVHLAAITPMIFPATDDDIVAHFRALRDLTPGRLFAYDFPEIAQNSISRDAALRLRGVVDGIKVSGSATKHVRSLADLGFIVYSGQDRKPSAVLAEGGVGVVSGTASAIPEHFAPLATGDFSAESELSRATDDIGGSIQLIKDSIVRRGIGYGGTRIPPAHPASSSIPTSHARRAHKELVAPVITT